MAGLAVDFRYPTGHRGLGAYVLHEKELLEWPFVVFAVVIVCVGALTGIAIGRDPGLVGTGSRQRS
jgi:hypothetical protein